MYSITRYQPSSYNKSYITGSIGWCRSRRKSASLRFTAHSPSSRFIAASRDNTLSFTRYTLPSPPLPRGFIISYFPAVCPVFILFCILLQQTSLLFRLNIDRRQIVPLASFHTCLPNLRKSSLYLRFLPQLSRTQHFPQLLPGYAVNPSLHKSIPSPCRRIPI